MKGEKNMATIEYIQRKVKPIYVDGKETPHFRVNYVLRAIVIPAENHEITFRFEPASYSTGNKISYASSGIFLLLILGYFVTRMRSKTKSE